ncbi:hypothetical protein [Legionella septentrionalis]|uniref:Uncharacterized protein n=1 Tax=Legionella septentrionalis TaxID=2498109 RepID=A0A3S0WZK8_9GAMM|nr:hypothetical protein [Legionella septentrionalis]RUQ84454.1 hypothetical protein EKM59_08760 [Legionella septentrionalis]RUR09257.1 hypothetical protein ELY14_09265 [Legionella septentrionalis]RUR14475.1 hypothetical protein ELY10_08555 [Legionella septentrionalis]
MSIPAYPKALIQLMTNHAKNLHTKNEANVPNDVPLPVEYNEGVVREMQVKDSVEFNIDANDMPLEVEKNLKANLGPVDTEAELSAHGLKDKKDFSAEVEEAASLRPSLKPY